MSTDLQDLKKVKKLVQVEKQPMPRLSEDFFAELENKIMAKIEKTEIKQPERFDKLRRHYIVKAAQKFGARGAAVFFVALLAIGGLSQLQSPNTQWDVSAQMAEQAHQNSDDLASLMTYQSEHDFFVDVASQSLDHLTKEQFERLIESVQ